MLGQLKARRRKLNNDWRPTGSRGQVLVMFGMMLFLLFGIIALSVDAGFLMAERRQVQNSADAAALAAAKDRLHF